MLLAGRLASASRLGLPLSRPGPCSARDGQGQGKAAGDLGDGLEQWEIHQNQGKTMGKLWEIIHRWMFWWESHLL